VIHARGHPGSNLLLRDFRRLVLGGLPARQGRGRRPGQQQREYKDDFEQAGLLGAHGFYSLISMKLPASGDALQGIPISAAWQ
jgi:hypothetical protein